MRRAKTIVEDGAKRGRAAELLHRPLDRHGARPFYQQVTDRIRAAIRSGVLKPGERLPSTRNLASQLSTSRNTIDLAYGVLASEGYVRGRGSAGTVVTAPGRAGSPPPATVAVPSSVGAVAPFRMGLPALDAFPARLWARQTARRARMVATEAMLVGDPVGYGPLRQAIASYLAVARGVRCDPEQVIVTSGFQAALGLITRVFLTPGDEAWCEDPGFFMARLGLEAAGARVVAVPVDDDGLVVDAGVARAPRARLAYVTPAHQAPLGTSLSPERRRALLDWAATAGAWIVEDDYDSEFRYGSPPLPSVAGMDAGGRVLFVGSFSKVLFPGLRLGYVVVPPAAVDRVRRACELLYRDRTTLPQAIVADFMTTGQFARHIKRMRALYAERRAALTASLEAVLGARLTIHLGQGGMHLVATLGAGEDDVRIAQRAQDAGLAPAPISPWITEHRGSPALLLSFTNIAPKNAPLAVRRLARVLDEPPHGR
jgi:GntR family transcriptional regulator/MocR family aminotransferase